MSQRRWFPFVQLEFTHSLGPHAGRYVLEQQADPRQREAGWDRQRRGDGAATAAATSEAEAGRRVSQAAARDRAQEAVPAGGATGPGVGAQLPVEDGPVPVRSAAEEQEALLGSADVLVIQFRGAPAAKRGLFGGRGKPKPAKEDDDPGEVSLNVATLIRGGQMLEDERAGQRLLGSLDPEGQERWAQEAIRDVNRAVAAYRVSAADPYTMDVTRADPRIIRVGYGIGEEVFAGRWTQALALPLLPAPRLSRAIRLAPTQGTAAILGGSSPSLEAEELVLRGLLDLDQGRLRAAAVGLQAGLDLLLAELAGQRLPGAVRMQVDQITELRQPLAVLAAQARREPLGATARQALADHAEQIGATIDRWRYEPLGY